ncbi:MAG: S-layer protein domain-containing protein [Methanolobus sp.]|nr:S-layer protein domain-containing protein [Methanolobus sp.]
MNKLITTVMVAIMVLALIAVPASAADKVEIRSTVLTGAGTLDATNFAGFYYDLDDNLSTETLTINAISTRTIEADDLEYNSSIESVGFASANLPGTYNIMGLFAEKYVPLTATSPDKLSKLLLDEDEKYTLRTGTALELSNGYAITAKQIDVEGNKVWMEFTKDGDFIEDEILDLAIASPQVWTFETEVADEDDIVVMKVAVTNVFQGQVDSLAIIDGVFLMDYENVLEIETDDTFDKLEVATVGSDYLLMTNPDAMTLTRDKEISLAEGMSFKVADDAALRFYLMKEFTEPGTYEVRGEVVTGAQTWTAANFAGFYYDLDDNLSTESLTINAISTRTIEADDLEYNTSIDSVGFASANLPGTYNIMGLFAEKYVPLTATSPDKLSKLLLDEDEKYTLRTGTALELSNGYAITAKQIDVEGNKVWMEFTKDGDFIEDEILDLAIASPQVWTFETDVADEDDIVVMKVAVTNVFQGQVDSLAIIDGVFLMDYENVLEIETDDAFDKLEVATVGSDYLLMTNPNTMTLTRDKEISIGEGMSFKVADDAALRFYPFVEVTIEDDGVTQPDEPVDETPVDETPVDETPVDETPVDETPVDETPVDEPEAPVDEEPAEPSPGFEIVFAVAGLLAVAYLVRRN